MCQCFNSTEVAERITDRIIEEANPGEQHIRDYLRKNLEFTKPAIDEITGNSDRASDSQVPPALGLSPFVTMVAFPAGVPLIWDKTLMSGR
jgi:murein DD-endopeptidase MepM/ murein hydrolase activator NlpD